MKSFKVTDKDGNVYIMTPVDMEARQAIDEAKNLEFNEDYFTSEVSQDQKTVNVGLNGVPIGVDSDSPLKFVQDTPQGIVFGSDASFATAIAPEYSPSSTYAMGDHCMHLGKYYECSTAISTAEAWNSSHWTETTIDAIMSKVVVFNVSYNTTTANYDWPSYSEVNAAFTSGKRVYIIQLVYMVGSEIIYSLQTFTADTVSYYFFISCIDDGRHRGLKIKSDGTVETLYCGISSEAIAPDYDPTSTYPTVGTAVIHNGLRYVNNTAITSAEAWDPSHWDLESVEDTIGNVETLLAAL